MKKVIIYHDDADGRCAAAIAGRHMPAHYESIQYIPADYSQPVPCDQLAELKFGIDELWIVDFSYGLEMMKKLHEMLGSTLMWFDHHKTALEGLQELDTVINGVRAVNKAACLLVWWWCSTQVEPPMAVKYIADRDMWYFQHGDNTRDFYEMYLSEETHPSSEIWDDYFSMPATEMAAYRALGNKLYRARIKNLKFAAERYGYECQINGTRCLKVNHPASGDMGQVIKALGYDLAWVYIEKYEDGKMIRTNTLYSSKIDVSEICKAKGGGGHKGAAGYVEELTTTQ